MSRGEQLLEYVQTARPSAVDRVKGLIKGVKLLGEKSANAPPRNNVYPRSTREAAAPLFLSS